MNPEIKWQRTWERTLHGALPEETGREHRRRVRLRHSQVPANICKKWRIFEQNLQKGGYNI